ncbi:hypothetical protein B0H34DRAFT_398452 [Crassisporium funariophilum]|nr:hypothetical protein B0H34DRAFT_398452 [Crassisporium funariophilum]
MSLGRAFLEAVCLFFLHSIHLSFELRWKTNFLMPQFHQDLLETADSPNIYVTSPTATSSSRFPPPLSMKMHSILKSFNSSPTTAKFASHSHHNHSLNHHVTSQTW